MVKLSEVERTATFVWSHDSLPLLATGSAAGAVDLDFSASSKLEIWDILSSKLTKEPIVSAALDTKFHALAWSKKYADHTNGMLVGALENSIVQFWDAKKLIDG
ncbi:hypothetical protein PACTADRAFT_42028, partial [Pachysolen tannophilus NRRL Y-2460]